MRTLFYSLLTLLFLVTLNSPTLAQDLTVKDRSIIELNMGLWGGPRVSNTIGAPGVRSVADVSSFVGNILYAYGLREEMSVTVSAGVLSAGASSNAGILGVQQQASTVIPILLGIRYYVPAPEQDARIRPFVSVAVGPYIGIEASSSIGTTLVQESTTESAFGGRLGVGLDLFTGYRFKFVVNAGYNLMTNFSSPISARNNFDGGDFLIGVGYAF